MKIGYIGIKGLPSKAGADRVVEAIVSRLKNKHAISVYCSSLVIPPGATYPGVELIRIPVLRGKHLHPTSLFIFSALHALQRDFDLIHLHNLEAFFVTPLLKTRHKVVATSHGAYLRDKWEGWAKAFIRLSTKPVRLSDEITSVSKPQIEYDQKQYGRIVRYIPNGVDPVDDLGDVRSAKELLQNHNVDPDAFILFAAGRVIPTKGASVLLKAYRELRTEQKLLIVGDISQMPEYENELKQLSDPRVIFIPFIDKNVLLGLVKLTSLFVFPSTIEAMSMMLLEAAMQETPIICSNLPENTEVLPNQALFFKSGDHLDLLTKMEWALNHPNEMSQLGSSAKEQVIANYAWDVIVDQYNHLYQSVINNVHT